MRNFKYIERPDIFIGYRPERVKCDGCGQIKNCYDAESYHGSKGLFGLKRLNSICSDCLIEGELKKWGAITCSGDVEELEEQIRKLNPTLSIVEIEQLVTNKTEELQTRTPRLITWQDWDWPCIDGDYGKFIGYGSKPLFGSLCKKNSAKEYFINSLYKGFKINEPQYLWDECMPEESIKDYENSSVYGTLFYVFKSLSTDKIATTWDSN